MLEVKGLAKEYPTPRGPLSVLADASLSLSPDDAAVIMGPSGSGKSTLLYILGALEPPTSGRVLLDGKDPFELPPSELAAFRNKEIGFVFQDHCLLPQCTVIENVLVPTLVGDEDPHALAHARGLIDAVGLTDRMTHRPAELSGGGETARRARARVDPPAPCASVRRADWKPRSHVGRCGCVVASGSALAAPDNPGRRDSQSGSRRAIPAPLRAEGTTAETALRPHERCNSTRSSVAASGTTGVPT